MKILPKLSLNYHQISSNTHLISSAGRCTRMATSVSLSANYAITFEKMDCLFVFVILKVHNQELAHQKQDDFSGQFFRIFKIIIFCFVVAI